MVCSQIAWQKAKCVTGSQKAEQLISDQESDDDIASINSKDNDDDDADDDD